MGWPALYAKSKAIILIASLCAQRKICALFPKANRGKNQVQAALVSWRFVGERTCRCRGPNSVKPDRRANEPAATNGFCN